MLLDNEYDLIFHTTRIIILYDIGTKYSKVRPLKVSGYPFSAQNLIIREYIGLLYRDFLSKCLQNYF